jgi:ribosomal protein S27AE
MSFAKVEHIEADALEALLEDVHPRLRDKYLRRPEPETAKCRACGQRFALAHLTDDLLCGPCDEAVAAMEAGQLP